MKHYTFSNFLVTDENRRAFDIARAIAELKAGQSMPLVLLGDDGSGKTHLLYAIVNHLRASSSSAGLAYLTPTDFPEPVRQLIDDPTRVERAANAVLLVDQLDALDTLDSSSTVAEELEAVIRIFIDNGHYVVLASNAHPDRIRQLPEGIGQLVSQGTVITLPPHGAEAQARLIEEKIRQEQSGAIEAQQREIESLKQQLAAMKPAAQHEDSDLQRRFDVAKAFGESLQRDLEVAREEITALKATAGAAVAAEPSEDIVAELNQLRERAAEAQHENENLREERNRVQEDWSKTKARASELETEINTLREQLKTAWNGEARTKAVEDNLAAANARIAELEAQVTDAEEQTSALRSESDQRVAAIEAERDAVRGELEETRARHDAASQEAASLLQRAEGLVELVEANRARFRQVEETQREQIDALEKLIEERAAQSVHKDEFDRVQQEANDLRTRAEKADRDRDEVRASLEPLQSELEEAKHALQSAQSELDEFRSAHDAAIADAKREADNIAEERDRIAVELTTIAASNDTLEARLAESDSARRAVESELEDTKRAFETATAEAAGNLAAANARTGDLEDRLSAAEDALSMLRGVVQGFAGDLKSFANEMRSGAQELDDMAGRLTTGERRTDPEAGEVAEAAMIEAVDESDSIIISDSDPIVIEDAPTPASPMTESYEEDITIETESGESPVDLDPLDAIVEQYSAEAEDSTESIAEFPDSSEPERAEPAQDESFENPSNGHHDSTSGPSNGHLKHDGYGLPTHELELPNWNGPVESQPAQHADDEEETIPTHDIDNPGL